MKPRTTPRDNSPGQLWGNKNRRDNSPDNFRTALRAQKPGTNPQYHSIPLGNLSRITRRDILAGGGGLQHKSRQSARTTLRTTPPGQPAVCPAVCPALCPAPCPALCPSLCPAYRGGCLCRRAFVKRSCLFEVACCAVQEHSVEYFITTRNAAV